MLKLKNIKKDYPMGDSKVEALKGVSLEFRKNEFVAILGPSGCGKTTLLNIIGGLDRYTSGDLIINGKSTKFFRDYDWDSYRNHTIGFVFQSYNLIHHQNVLGNVELALTLSGISKAERKARAIAALESVGLHDQIYKKPNQLSGGQMQRVAIARALVNNPDIILADEPTGAIDSETSIQIMEILKEISKDRLVIMVTHNPDLANRYATRIIRLLDGLIIDDTKPYYTEEPKFVPEPRKKRRKGVSRKERTSMSFITAFGLSLKNLLTKKWRTLMVAFAGSIGIIGIALVASVANGFQNYVNKMQSDTLSGYPLEIAAVTPDIDQIMGMQPYRDRVKEYPTEEKVYITKSFRSAVIINNLSLEYIENVIKNIDPDLYNSIIYEYDTAFNVFKDIDNADEKIYKRISMRNWSQIPKAHTVEEYSFFKSQYDIIGGRAPQNKEDIVLVVNKFNQISDEVFEELGINIDSDRESFDFEELLGTKYKLFLNDIYYSFNGTRFYTREMNEDLYNSTGPDVVELEIVGIVRTNEATAIGALTGAIGYTLDLFDYIFERNSNSEIVKWTNENEELDPETGKAYSGLEPAEMQREAKLIKFGGLKKPKRIKVYPVDFASKEAIKDYLDEWNNARKEEAIAEYYREHGITEETATPEQKKAAEKAGHDAGVYYTDLMGVMVDSLNTLIDAISIVLIVFTSISLVVSSIMIGIITYISVLERTKEIGILRSIGARKKDIARVFNAEAIIIGLLAGTLGIFITVTALIPINSILKGLTSISNLAILSPITAIALILISVLLTFIAGLIPSSFAAKRDPVIALRTE